MTKSRLQLFIVHGGMTFKNDRDYLRYLKTRKISLTRKIKWYDKYLDEKLGKQLEIIRPKMPLAENAKYRDWKIHFERYFPLLRNNLILMGGSLGGLFLAKYLSENKFPKKILSVYLICPPFDNSLGHEDLAGGFKLKSNLSLLEKNTKKVTLMFAKHDPVVPVGHAKKYGNKLKNARIIIYKHIKGHFELAKFPQLIKMIKSDLKL